MEPQYVAEHCSCGQLFAAYRSHDAKPHSCGYLFEVCSRIVNSRDPSRTLTLKVEPARPNGRAWLRNMDRRTRCRRASKSWQHLALSSLCQPAHVSSKQKNLLLLNPNPFRPSRRTRVNTSNASVTGQAAAPVPSRASVSERAR